jgi:hypothetical protein
MAFEHPASAGDAPRIWDCRRRTAAGASIAMKHPITLQLNYAISPKLLLPARRQI